MTILRMAFIDVRSWMTSVLLIAACSDDGVPADGGGESTGGGEGTTSSTTLTTGPTTSSSGTTTEATTTATATDSVDGSSGDATSLATTAATEGSSGATDTGATDASATGTGATDTGVTDTGATDTATTDTGVVPDCDCGQGEYCDWPDDQCGAGEQAVCMLEPDFCIEIFDPVCGCDGMTYGNSCLAAAEGVDVDYEGECGGMMDCACAEGEYCDWPDDQCGGGEPGECAALPGNCPGNVDPVCGCDGVTYDNECEANAAGQDVAFEGPCGGMQMDCLDCANDEYCAQDDGVCNPDLGGTCMPIPDICILIKAPVCGCDGMTYSNSCFANSAGQNVAYDGECQ